MSVVINFSSYVSDDMTPEEIMKKFEALEEFQRKKAEKRNHVVLYVLYVTQQNEKSPDSSVQGSKPEEPANECVHPISYHFQSFLRR